MQNINVTEVIGLKERLERGDVDTAIHYQHAQLPDAFIEKAGRVYDRLKGIDKKVDRETKAEWVDRFRGELNYEVELEAYVQCLTALSKFSRKGRGVRGMTRKGLYYLAFTRTMCEDPEETFRLLEKYHGFRFPDSDKKRLIRVIDSCVRYSPLLLGRLDGHTSKITTWLASDYGSGKTGYPFLPHEPRNN